MDRKEFELFLSGLFKPYGYRKKGNYWFADGEKISKVINLQKSNFGNVYYINYGYVLNNLRDQVSLSGYKTHISSGLSSLDNAENQQIIRLLDFTNNLDDEVRKNLLTYYAKNMLNEMQSINTEDDIIGYLKHRRTLNDIRLPIIEHLNSDELLSRRKANNH